MYLVYEIVQKHNTCIVNTYNVQTCRSCNFTFVNFNLSDVQKSGICAGSIVDKDVKLCNKRGTDVLASNYNIELFNTYVPSIILKYTINPMSDIHKYIYHKTSQIQTSNKIELSIIYECKNTNDISSIPPLHILCQLGWAKFDTFIQSKPTSFFQTLHYINEFEFKSIDTTTTTTTTAAVTSAEGGLLFVKTRPVFCSRANTNQIVLDYDVSSFYSSIATNQKFHIFPHNIRRVFVDVKKLSTLTTKPVIKILCNSWLGCMRYIYPEGYTAMIDRGRKLISEFIQIVMYYYNNYNPLLIECVTDGFKIAIDDCGGVIKDNFYDRQETCKLILKNIYNIFYMPQTNRYCGIDTHNVFKIGGICKSLLTIYIELIIRGIYLDKDTIHYNIDYKQIENVSDSKLLLLCNGIELFINCNIIRGMKSVQHKQECINMLHHNHYTSDVLKFFKIEQNNADIDLKHILHCFIRHKTTRNKYPTAVNTMNIDRIEGIIHTTKDVGFLQF